MVTLKLSVFYKIVGKYLEIALKFSRTKRFDLYSYDELAHLADRATFPKGLVLETAKETVELFHQHWNSEKANLPLDADASKAVEAHVRKVPLARG